jgi:ubiquinone/menaquinone biosynthesis C-methylase UbiE
MKADIDLYETAANKYEELQMLRHDYSGARKAFCELSQKYLKERKNIKVVDFCSGTGADTKFLADCLSVSDATLVDINEQFLEIAKKSSIKARIKVCASDILAVNFKPEADAVISMFAYHHVPDDRKEEYLQKVKGSLKPGGILILGEIYMSNKETTLDYYRQLYNSIDKKSPELENFLMQTAQSDNFEYKVARGFACKQLISAGFKLLESRKIWPADDSFGREIGTFVEIWQIQ